MKKIFKYILKPSVSQLIEVPKGATILSAGVQFDDICIWILVNPIIEEKESKTIKVIGTGIFIDLEKEHRFINTVQLLDGGLIFHIFEQL